jgi:hypothetical protein
MPCDLAVPISKENAAFVHMKLRADSGEEA